MINEMIKKVIVITTLFIVIFVGIASAIAVYLDDAYFLNRFGALLSGIGALVVIFQIAMEVKNERLARIDREKIFRGTIEPNNVELAQRILSRRQNMFEETRIAIVLAVAMLVVFGEMVHGWGDVLLLLAGISAAH